MAQAVPPVDAGAAAPLNVEVRSIDYVPRGERHGKAWHLGAVWFVGNAELVSFATGPIGISLGLNFAWTAVAILLGTLLGALFMAFHSAQGPKLGLSQMIQSRAQFGYLGALLPIIAVLFVTIGYGVFDTVLGGEVFTATIRTGTRTSYVLFAALALLLTVFGYRVIHRFSRWASMLYIVNFGLFTVIALVNVNLPSAQLSLSSASFQWGPFLIVLGALMSYNLTWSPYVSDYSRYLPANSSTGATFTWTYWGAVIGTIWPAILGALVGAAHPDLSPVGAVKEVADTLFQGWGAWTVILMAPTLIVAATFGVYTAGLSSLAAVDVGKRIRSGVTTRVAAMSCVAVVMLGVTLLIPEDFLSSYNAFLILALYFLIPWTAVNLADFFLVRNGQYSIKQIFSPNGIYGRWGWRGLVSYLIGLAVMVPFFSTTIYTGPVASAVGGGDLSPFIGFPVAAVLYYLLSRNLDVKAEARLAAKENEELEEEARLSPLGS
ncbi:MAG TPA: cytosine permease [Actinomycetes bacterium]|nr:cytosine permease [Actinomycetes bacterium]